MKALVSEFLKRRAHNRRLKLLRKKLLKCYVRYRDITDQFSCGLRLAEHVSPRVRDARLALNEAIVAMKEVDPSCKVSLVPDPLA